MARDRVARTRNITARTARNPPIKDPIAISIIPDEVKTTIANAAPKFAPPAIPIISGEANGFLKII